MGLDAKKISEKVKSFLVDMPVCLSSIDVCICRDVLKRNIRSSFVRSEPSQGGDVEVVGESSVLLSAIGVALYGWDWM